MGVNEDWESGAHVDPTNAPSTSFIRAFGQNLTGGNLRIYETSSVNDVVYPSSRTHRPLNQLPPYESYDITQSPINYNSRMVHEVEPFTGKRYTMTLYMFTQWKNAYKMYDTLTMEQWDDRMKDLNVPFATFGIRKAKGLKFLH